MAEAAHESRRTSRRTPNAVEPETVPLIPPTRYQGSKRKLCPWIRDCLAPVGFDTLLDAFGGTGSVAYMFKALGKRVTCNDLLRFNEQVAIALIENDLAQLSERTINRILGEGPPARCGTFIADTFRGIYYTDQENAWLDRVSHRIRAMRRRHDRALAWYALGQAAIAKRPYNLFHRRNLYMRTATVARTFGNKRTWDRPFEEHFRRHAEQANGAVFDGGGTARVSCCDVLAVPGDFDLVYLDPPYINRRGVSVDYDHYYHFLEGMLDYRGWGERVEWSSKHRRLRTIPSPWTRAATVHAAFDDVFDRFRRCTLAVSYRTDGIPTIGALRQLLRRHKQRVKVHERKRYQYVLSTNSRSSEVLLIAT